MPDRPLRPCATPWCPNLVPKGRCPPCQSKRYAQQDAARGTSTERGYGAAWRRLRAQVLAEEPLCRACFAEGLTVPSEEVDHALPKLLGGTDDRSNLAGLCARHNAAKGGREAHWPPVPGTVSAAPIDWSGVEF